ncbi:MAG: DUF4412 domain-containing protein [Saprospiraceae bacterium]
MQKTEPKTEPISVSTRKWTKPGQSCRQAGESVQKEKTDDELQVTTPEEEGTPQEETTTDDNNSSPFGGISFGGEFEPYQNEVLLSMSIDITNTNARGKEDKATVHYTLDTWQTGLRMEAEEAQTRIILDNEKGYMTVVTASKDQAPTGMRMRQRSFKTEDAVMDETEMTVTETGRTRVIDGYNCREYKIEHEHGTTHSWITNDLDLDPMVMAKAFAAQAGQGKKGGPAMYDIAGFPIESTTVSKNGKDTSLVHFYNIRLGDDRDMSVFDLSGIEVMNMGF